MELTMGKTVNCQQLIDEARRVSLDTALEAAFELDAIETVLPAPREVRRKFVLALAQNVERQVLASPQMFKHHGAMVHAHQHQRRIERNRRK